MSDLTVQDGRVVLIHYVLKDDEGDVLDQSDAEPLAYLHGAQNIVPGLERALTGKKAGDEVHADIPPADAYGELKADAYESVHRSAFPKGMEVEVGMPVHAQGSDGKPMVLWIHEVEGARVTVTTNHPLAGRTLHFDVRIDEVREASAEELAHGHVHGPHGHHHH
jgi:FKBP-type peptidyl-prolyl cis-trans isomerase SlyD